MAERVDQIIGHRSLAKPLLSTFHCFCVRVLRRDIEALRVNGKGLHPQLRDLRRDRSAGGGQGRRIKRLAHRRQATEAARRAGPDLVGEEPHDRSAGVLPCLDQPDEERIAHIFEIYRKELLKANALDFDDLLLESRAPAEGRARSRANATTGVTNTC